MKLRPLAFMFFPVAAACVISYAFLDIPAARFCASLSGATKAIFGVITWFGRSDPYLIASAIGIIWFAFVQKRPLPRNAAIFVFAAVALSGLANDLIKFLVGRSRPTLLLDGQIYGFRHFALRYGYQSFPSGHANTIVALCYSLFLLRDRLWYIYLTAALAVMASRVVLNADFPSDVIFGAYLAILVTELVRTALERKGLRISPAPGLPAKNENET